VGIAAPILVLVVSITRMIVSGLIVGENKRKISETDGKYIEIFGNILLIIISFSTLYFLDIMNPDVMKWFLLCALIIILGFHTFLEWYFMKESKQYEASLITLAVGIIYTSIFIF